MLEQIPLGSIVAVWKLLPGGNKQTGWLKSDGTVGSDVEEAVVFYSNEAFKANASFYSDESNAGHFTWPAKKPD